MKLETVIALLRAAAERAAEGKLTDRDEFVVAFKEAADRLERIRRGSRPQSDDTVPAPHTREA